MKKDKKSDLNRRTFLSRISAIITGFIAAIMGIPLTVFSFGPLFRKKPKGQWKEIADLTELTYGTVEEIEYLIHRREAWYAESVPRTVFAVKKGEHEALVFSAICTHLGCLVRWDARKGQFLCPCHGGVYDSEGRVVAGPPPRHLDRFAAKIENGKLFIMEIEEA